MGLDVFATHGPYAGDYRGSEFGSQSGRDFIVRAGPSEDLREPVAKEPVAVIDFVNDKIRLKHNRWGKAAKFSRPPNHGRVSSGRGAQSSRSQSAISLII